MLLCPVLPSPAPLHTGETILRFLDTPGTSLWNALELPATAVPLRATTRDGLPAAVQVVAGPGKDHLCIAVAAALEKAGVAASPSPFR